MKLLICDKTSPDAIEAMRQAGIKVDEQLDTVPDTLLATVPGYDAMVVRSSTKVTPAVIDAGTDLKLIIRAGVGLDNIDVAYAQSAGIVVRNTPQASADSVGELVIGYLCALSRRIPQATASMRAGAWKKGQLKGREIQGKTLGLIGFGNTGQAVGRRAHALGMRVLFYRRTSVESEYARQVTLDELLAQADYISLHVPLTEATVNLVDDKLLAKMKDSVYIIHCGRGGTLDEEALYNALRCGKVAGAALDVYEDEKVAKGHPKLFELVDDNGFHTVIGSPHIGAATVEGQRRVGQQVVQIAIDFMLAQEAVSLGRPKTGRPLAA